MNTKPKKQRCSQLPSNALLSDAIFVGSWGTVYGKAKCGGCGDQAKTGINITVGNEELNLCGTCGVKVKTKLIEALRERNCFDDIREGR